MPSAASRHWTQFRSGEIPEPAVLAGVLHVACGATVLVTSPMFPNLFDPRGVSIVAVAAILVGLVLPLLPWNRWSPSASQWTIPESLALVAAFNLTARAPFVFPIFYLVVWAWVGLTQPQGTALRFAPLLTVAYLVPAFALADSVDAAFSGIYTIPIAVVVGEIIATVATHLRESQRAVVRSEARYAALIRHSSEFILILDSDGVIQFSNDAITRILGWDAGFLVGQSASMLLHPEDRQMTEDWFDTLVEVGPEAPIETRCLHHDGSWVWIEAEVQDLLSIEAVGGVVVNGRDVSARRRAELELARAAYTDELTGLMNRFALQKRIASLLDRPSGQRFAVLYLDLDGFKIINDSLGHPVGDELLCEVSRRLRSVAPDITLGRIGGDEFVVLLETVADAARVDSLARMVVASFEQPFDVGDRRLQIGSSVGVATCDATWTVAEVFRSADLAMYHAKHRGGRQWAIFDAQMAADAKQRLETEQDLRDGLGRGELFVEFQPEVDIRSGMVVGAEALVRWNHPEHGRVGPDRFIGIAEETGLILPIGELVLETAVRQARAWADAGHPIRVAVNMSAHQLRRLSVVGLVASTLRRWKVRPEQLRIEITESCLLDPDLAGVTVPALRELGVSVAVDDFGTGYSSLSVLQNVTVDTLKIDKSFLADITGSDNEPLVAAIVAMADNLGLGVVAEGVENSEQVALLCRLGCTRAQGFLYSPSVDPATFDDILAGQVPAERRPTDGDGRFGRSRVAVDPRARAERTAAS